MITMNLFNYNCATGMFISPGHLPEGIAAMGVHGMPIIWYCIDN